MKINCTIFVLSFFLALTLNRSKLSSSENHDIRTEHKGIIVVGVNKPKQRLRHSEVIPSKLGVKKIKMALDLIFAKSPFNTKWIKHLQSFGKVIIVYNPEFPKRRF